MTKRFITGGSMGNTIDNAVDSALESVGIGVKPPDTPYIAKCREYAKKMMLTPFLQGWQWSIDVDGAPDDFDIFVKDIDFGNGSIDYDTFAVGSGSIAVPTFSSASEITMTVRDSTSLKVDKWFAAQLAKVKNPDGTVNLPKDYVFNLTINIVLEDMNKIKFADFRVSASKKGNQTLTREGVNEFITYPLTFQKFSSVGSKAL